MHQAVNVVSRTSLSNSFLGNPIQIGFVVRDYRAAVEGMIKLGIGPWTLRRFDDAVLSERTYRGQSSGYCMDICGARTANNIGLEIVAPISGPSIYTEFLDRYGDGVQHFAFDCADAPYDATLSKLSSMGYELIQSGLYCGRCRFHYFATERHAKTIIEVFDIPKDFVFPVPDRWFPGPPPHKGD